LKNSRSGLVELSSATAEQMVCVAQRCVGLLVRFLGLHYRAAETTLHQAA